MIRGVAGELVRFHKTSRQFHSVKPLAGRFEYSAGNYLPSGIAENLSSRGSQRVINHELFVNRSAQPATEIATHQLVPRHHQKISKLVVERDKQQQLATSHGLATISLARTRTRGGFLLHNFIVAA